MCDSNIKSVCEDIKKLFLPEKMIIFSQKVINGKVKSFKVCAVIKSGDPIKTEHDIYLTVESQIPYDVIVYSPEEWERLLQKENSFASQIAETGYEYNV